MTINPKWELVAGLEVHVELATDSKIFCGCSTRFGGEPNTQACPVCTGMPGALPALNRQVVEFALRAGLALHCRIRPTSRFDRKHYVYPDLPKAYQITQYDSPICQDGFLSIQTAAGVKVIGIRQIHMEEDAGKLFHRAGESCTLVDYNRCGVPLLEIVSEPDFRSADEVTAYLEALRETLLFLGVSDCKMQEGSMRVDLNLSVRLAGSQEAGVRTEMKNLNSFRCIRRAMQSEFQRQTGILEGGGEVVRETRRWDAARNVSESLRSKEAIRDYRYCPEPDLPPVVVDPAWLESVRASMPELADAKRERYQRDHGLTREDARALTSSRELAALFEETARLSGEARESANLIRGPLLELMGERRLSPEIAAVDPSKLAVLIRMIQVGTINRGVAKDVLDQVLLHDVDPESFVAKHGLSMERDSAKIRAAVDAVLAENPKSAADYLGGKEKALGFLVGRVMGAMQGRADPQVVSRVLRARLSEQK